MAMGKLVRWRWDGLSVQLPQTQRARPPATVRRSIHPSHRRTSAQIRPFGSIQNGGNVDVNTISRMIWRHELAAVVLRLPVALGCGGASVQRIYTINWNHGLSKPWEECLIKQRKNWNYNRTNDAKVFLGWCRLWLKTFLLRCCTPLDIRVTWQFNQHEIHDLGASVRSAESPPPPKVAFYFQPQRQRSPQPWLSIALMGLAVTI